MIDWQGAHENGGRLEDVYSFLCCSHLSWLRDAKESKIDIYVVASYKKSTAIIRVLLFTIILMFQTPNSEY